jgi:tRNA U54 and U55 pseudouridine synthase Pus10
MSSDPLQPGELQWARALADAWRPLLVDAAVCAWCCVRLVGLTDPRWLAHPRLPALVRRTVDLHLDDPTDRDDTHDMDVDSAAVCDVPHRSCPACLGLLPAVATPDFDARLSAAVFASGYVFDHYSVRLLLPPQVVVRDRALESLFARGLDAALAAHRCLLMPGWRQRIGEIRVAIRQRIAATVDAQPVADGRQPIRVDAADPNAPPFLFVTCDMAHAATTEEPRCIAPLFSRTQQARYEQLLKSASHAAPASATAHADAGGAGDEDSLTGLFGVASVSKLLQKITDAKLATLPGLPDLGAAVTTPPSLTLSVEHQPIFIGGRYNKYCRHLSQTPWLVHNERITTTSLQEFVVPHLLRVTGGSAAKLLSSGREDVDVRMLGLGRPFACEIANPRCARLSLAQLTDIQLSINASTDRMAVRQMHQTNRLGMLALHEGQEEKRKTYGAVIWISQSLSAAELERINAMHDLAVEQWTPLRVLHRRSQLCRTKLVYSLHLRPLTAADTAAHANPHVCDRIKCGGYQSRAAPAGSDLAGAPAGPEDDDDAADPPELPPTAETAALRSGGSFYWLALTTQAGTYIKEFVHGDMGRTSPSLRSLLRAVDATLDCDILSLDVLQVDLKWPHSEVLHQ